MTLQFAVDTGGTFTDLVVDGEDHLPRFYKRSTTPANPIDGLLDVFTAAASDYGLDLREFLGRGESLVFGTTRATNAVVTGTAAKTALLCTRGHPDMLLIREGGGRTTLFDYTQEYPAPYVPRSLTFEIPERVWRTARSERRSTRVRSWRSPRGFPGSRSKRSQCACSGRSSTPCTSSVSASCSPSTLLDVPYDALAQL